jgi:hypothetical protein
MEKDESEEFESTPKELKNGQWRREASVAQQKNYNVSLK